MEYRVRAPQPKLRTRTSTLQARHGEQDNLPYATKYSCSTHLVSYYAPVNSPVHCPVCALEEEVEQVRTRYQTLANELEMARNKLERLQPQVDLVTAMRGALEVTEKDDLVWLKTQMYQYKIDKSVTLKVTHGKIAGSKRRRRADTERPNGFMALPRGGEPEGYLCTSIGGLAIADYFDEALHTVGSAQAMGMLLKAMWQVLPGAVT